MTLSLWDLSAMDAALETLRGTSDVDARRHVRESLCSLPNPCEEGSRGRAGRLA